MELGEKPLGVAPEELQSGRRVKTQEDFMTDNRKMPPDNSGAHPDPGEKLVKVFDAEQESEVLVVSGLLESAGIEHDVTSTDAAQNIYPGVGGSIILVREDQAEEARRIIDAYRRSDDTAEIDISGETLTN
jgi:hypothetical protein